MSGQLLRAARTGQRFLQWWKEELVECAQQSAAFVAPKWRRPVISYVKGTTLMFFDGDAKHQAELGAVDRSSFKTPFPESLPAALRAALGPSRRVRIIVDAQHAFIRPLKLPLAALAYIKSAVSLQHPKLLPLDPGQLLTDFVIAGTEVSGGVLHIDIAALKRADVDWITQAVLKWNLRVASIHLSEGPTNLPRFRFRTAAGSRGALLFNKVERTLVTSAAVLALCCGLFAVTQSVRAHAALSRALAQSSDSAAIALSHRQQLSNRLEPLKTLSRLEGTPSAVQLLAEITTLIPPDSWVTEFELKQRTLRLVGISPDPAELIKRLASASSLSSVELRSSMSVGIGTGKDRFEISAETKADPP